jgi:hypothetical protein
MGKSKGMIHTNQAGSRYGVKTYITTEGINKCIITHLTGLLRVGSPNGAIFGEKLCF